MCSPLPEGGDCCNWVSEKARAIAFYSVRHLGCCLASWLFLVAYGFYNKLVDEVFPNSFLG